MSTMVVEQDLAPHMPTPPPAVASAISAPVGFDPVDLDSVPEVDALVGSLGMGRFVRSGLTAPFGRNDIWFGPTTAGPSLFVKRMVGHPDDLAGRMRRLLTFQDVLDQPRAGALRCPDLLGTDPDHQLVAFEALDDAATGSSLMVDEAFTDADAEAVGAAVAELHGLRPPAADVADTTRPALPSLSLIEGVPLSVYENLSFGEIEVWRLQQNDGALIESLHRLDRAETAAPRVPAHCDLRVDQLLRTQGDWWITDWEEFRLADPARDVGSFAGEWLYRAVLDIVTTRGDFTFVEASLDHATVLSRGAERIQGLRPRIQAFWAAYRAGRPNHDAELPVRAAAFAGWHMLDRLIAGSSVQGRLSAIERAAAGIGRSVLLDPARFATTIGLGTPS